MTSDQYEIYSLQAEVNGLHVEVRSPLLTLLRAILGKRDYWVLGPAGVEYVGFFRTARWPAGAVNQIRVIRRKIQGSEMKRPNTGRSWRVQLMNSSGEIFSRSFRFKREANAEIFADRLRRELKL